MTMIARFFILFILSGAVSTTQAQQTFHGQVLGSGKKPVSAATIALLNQQDSTVLRQVITDENGQFRLLSDREGLFLSVSAIGYRKFYGRFKNMDTLLPAIILQPAENELAGVTVSAGKSFTEQKIDRTVVNVDAMISNTGATALEVLEKTPGVIVDENGGITYKGKSSVLIMIDDKPTYLSMTDLITYLRSLPSSALDKIELMDNPPAKYDASGNGGVINIKTKKLKAKGLNGSLAVSAGQSFYARTNESLNLNYNTGKINVFGNLGYFANKGFRELFVNRDYYSSPGQLGTAFKQTNLFTPVTKSPNGKIGFDFYSSPATTWGIVYTGSRSDRDEYRPTYSSIFNGAGALDSSIVAANSSKSYFNKNGVNLNYTHKLDSTGKVLSFDIDYLNYKSDAAQIFANKTLTSSGSMKSEQNINAQLPSDISIYAAKLDYSHPFSKTLKMEAGLKSSYVNSDNMANYFNVAGGISTVDYNNTNHFIYKENVNAAYLNFTKEFKRFSFQAGLRMENTNGDGHQLGNLYKPDSAFTKHYTDLFPTAYVSYKLDSAGNDLLNLSYGRRIDRPNYQDLNPFIFLLDKFTAFSGNPFLRPQYSSDYKISFTHKNRFTLSAQYVHTYDIQIETIDQTNGIFISRNGNIGQWNYLVLSLETTLHPAKWWSVNAYLDLLNYQQYKGQLASGNIETKSVYTFQQLTNQFTLNKEWSAELSGFYCSPRQQAQFDKIAFGQFNAAIQKKIWNNKGTIKLSARDIFNTNTSTGFITNIPNTIAHYQNKFHNQVIVLGLTYSFGKQLNTPAKRKTGSAETEAGRAGN